MCAVYVESYSAMKMRSWDKKRMAEPDIVLSD